MSAARESVCFDATLESLDYISVDVYFNTDFTAS